jgi:hypothetical protein
MKNLSMIILALAISAAAIGQQPTSFPAPATPICGCGQKLITPPGRPASGGWALAVTVPAVGVAAVLIASHIHWHRHARPDAPKLRFRHATAAFEPADIDATDGSVEAMGR